MTELQFEDETFFDTESFNKKKLIIIAIIAIIGLFALFLWWRLAKPKPPEEAADRNIALAIRSQEDVEPQYSIEDVQRIDDDSALAYQEMEEPVPPEDISSYPRIRVIDNSGGVIAERPFNLSAKRFYLKPREDGEGFEEGTFDSADTSDIFSVDLPPEVIPTEVQIVSPDGDVIDSQPIDFSNLPRPDNPPEATPPEESPPKQEIDCDNPQTLWEKIICWYRTIIPAPPVQPVQPGPPGGPAPALPGPAPVQPAPAPGGGGGNNGNQPPEQGPGGNGGGGGGLPGGGFGNGGFGGGGFPQPGFGGGQLGGGQPGAGGGGFGVPHKKAGEPKKFIIAVISEDKEAIKNNSQTAAKVKEIIGNTEPYKSYVNQIIVKEIKNEEDLECRIEGRHLQCNSGLVKKIARKESKKNLDLIMVSPHKRDKKMFSAVSNLGSGAPIISSVIVKEWPAKTIDVNFRYWFGYIIGELKSERLPKGGGEFMRPKENPPSNCFTSKNNCEQAIKPYLDKGDKRAKCSLGCWRKGLWRPANRIMYQEFEESYGPVEECAIRLKLYKRLGGEKVEIPCVSKDKDKNKKDGKGGGQFNVGDEPIDFGGKNPSDYDYPQSACAQCLSLSQKYKLTIKGLKERSAAVGAVSCRYSCSEFNKEYVLNYKGQTSCGGQDYNYWESESFSSGDCLNNKFYLLIAPLSSDFCSVKVNYNAMDDPCWYSDSKFEAQWSGMLGSKTCSNYNPAGLAGEGFIYYLCDTTSEYKVSLEPL